MPYPSIANRRLLITHRYSLYSDRNTVIRYLAAYWKSRGFTLNEDPVGHLVGARGSYLANFTSFDSTKLIASTVIECTESGDVATQTLIDLSGQILTSWNQLDLELEQVLCHRGFTGLPEPSNLIQYRKSHMLANVLWVLTLGMTTNVMPSKWKTILDDVNPSTVSPELRYLSPGEI